MYACMCVHVCAYMHLCLQEKAGILLYQFLKSSTAHFIIYQLHIVEGVPQEQELIGN